jgi:hypothetical protein
MATYKSLSVGGSWISGLRMDGNAVCFDSSGTVIVPAGTGTTGDGGVPITNFQLPPAGPYASISTGYIRGCGVKVDGNLACWGAIPSSEAIPQGTFTSVSVGDSFACAVRTDGTVACWNQFGAGGIFPPMDGGTPTALPDGKVTSISADSDFACGLRPDGTLACWGRDTFGDTKPPAGTFTAVSVAVGSACAIKTDGTLACWGDDSYGQATPPAGTFTALSMGYRFACAIRTDSSVACWGDNAMGQATPPLQETGGSGARLAIAPSALAFSTCLGHPSTPATLQVANTGDTAIGPVTSTLLGVNAEDFTLTSNDCGTLAPGATCTIRVAFDPKSVGGPMAASLQVTGPGPAPALVTVALSGVIPTSSIVISPSALDFGAVRTGASGTPQTLTVSDVGECAGDIGGPLPVVITGPDFLITNSTCSGSSIPAGGTCTITANFQPTTIGVKNATLTVVSPSLAVAVATLTGTAIAP